MKCDLIYDIKLLLTVYRVIYCNEILTLSNASLHVTKSSALELLFHCFIIAPIVFLRFCVWSLSCCAVLGVLNSFAIISPLGKSIRIYHECEGRIEKSILRITVWHHQACQVMTNDDLNGQIFLSYPHTNNGFLFLLTTVFYIKISFKKILTTLRCNFS